MKVHLRSGCTVLVLLAVLVTPSFSGLRGKDLKVQTVAVEGLDVRDGVVLAQDRYALLARYNPTKLAPEELITLANKDRLDNHNLFIYDSRNLEQPREISLGDVYFPELFFDPSSNLAYFLGTDFVKKDGASGDEIVPIDVIGYTVLSLDEEKPNAGSRVVRIEIPETGDSPTAEDPTTIALVGDSQIAFTKNRTLFVYDINEGTLGKYAMGSGGDSRSAVAIVGSHQKAGVLAIANQIAVDGDEGKAATQSVLEEYQVTLSGLSREFSRLTRHPPTVIMSYKESRR